MSAKYRLDPKTHGALRITVKDALGTLITNATAQATVYTPSGRQAATNVTLTNAGNGQYDLTILPAWSTAGDGSAIEGEFRALVTVSAGGVTRTRRFRFLLSYLD